MKRTLLLSLLVCVVCFVKAQDYPLEWSRYTGGRYLYDVQTAYNSRGMSEYEFKNYLAETARATLSRTLEVRVQDAARMDRSSIDGNSSISYSAVTQFSTDVTLKYVYTKTYYNGHTGEGAAIAYLDKEAACVAYKNEIDLIINRVSNTLATARSYINTGFKSRAEDELNGVLPYFVKTDDAFFALTFFESGVDINSLRSQCNKLQREVKQMLADLQHSSVIYLSCSADLLGTPYHTLGNEVKGVLSKQGCSFTNDRSRADWVITIKAEARTHSHSTYGATTTYFAYVDAAIIIDKAITSQRIYQDEVTIKGGHTRDYTAAARDAYQKISKRIGDAIATNIEL